MPSFDSKKPAARGNLLPLAGQGAPRAAASSAASRPPKAPKIAHSADDSPPPPPPPPPSSAGAGALEALVPEPFPAAVVYGGKLVEKEVVFSGGRVSQMPILQVSRPGGSVSFFALCGAPMGAEALRRRRRGAGESLDRHAMPTQFGTTVLGYHVRFEGGRPLPPKPMEAGSRVAVKVSSKAFMAELRARHRLAALPEDPFGEVAAMQALMGRADGLGALGAEDWGEDPPGGGPPGGVWAHPHLCPLLAAAETEEHLFLVLPWCDGGELFDSIAQRGTLPLSTALEYFQGMLEALLALRRAGVAHHDLSPENFMLHGGRVVAIDFGMAKRVPRSLDGTFHRVLHTLGGGGKARYAAPEYFLCMRSAGARVGGYDAFSHDLHCCAMTLWMMVAGASLWSDPLSRRAQYVSRHGGLMRLARHYGYDLPDALVHLLQDMLWHEPERRVGLREARERLQGIREGLGAD